MIKYGSISVCVSDSEMLVRTIISQNTYYTNSMSQNFFREYCLRKYYNDIFKGNVLGMISQLSSLWDWKWRTCYQELMGLALNVYEV